MQQERISPNFYLTLLEFLMLAKQQVVAIGAEFGLTSIQAVTLLILDEHRPRPMKSFCSLYHCDASNVTGIVDGLEKKGLVSRQNDPSDRRVKAIQLEGDGKKLQRAMIGRLNANNGFLFDSLNLDEAQQLIHLVEKIVAGTARAE